ncbi:MAG: hypothetical protein JOZ17_09460, partial [Acetobacteraceae bacterium]|nr:hypothetical protein [Acetobacteraceae bacterium]
MKTRLTTQLSLAAVALAFAAGSPALAQGENTTTGAPHHHAMHHGTSRSAASAADHSADQLNAQSLAAAQAGQNFSPSGAGSAPGGSMGAGGG